MHSEGMLSMPSLCHGANMKMLKSVALISIILITTARADEICNPQNIYSYVFKNVAFQVPDCLRQNIENGNMVYRYGSGSYKSFIMIADMNSLTSQTIYDNLNEIVEKLAYLRRESIIINNFKVTLISFKSLIEASTAYEARTYIFDDLGIRFITHEADQDHLIFFDIVKSVRNETDGNRK